MSSRLAAAKEISADAAAAAVFMRTKNRAEGFSRCKGRFHFTLMQGLLEHLKTAPDLVSNVIPSTNQKPIVRKSEWSA